MISLLGVLPASSNLNHRLRAFAMVHLLIALTANAASQLVLQNLEHIGDAVHLSQPSWGCPCRVPTLAKIT
jgi:hypothetical protein